MDEDLCYDDVEAPTPPLENAARVRPSAAATTGLSPKAQQQAMASAATAPIDDVPPTYDELEADAPSPVCFFFLRGVAVFSKLFSSQAEVVWQ